MIGKITAKVEGKQVQIWIDNDCTLKCNDPDVKRFLLMKFDLYSRTYSPSDGPFGVLFLNEVADMYRGKADIEKSKAEKGVVY